MSTRNGYSVSDAIFNEYSREMNKRIESKDATIADLREKLDAYENKSTELIKSFEIFCKNTWGSNSYTRYRFCYTSDSNTRKVFQFYLLGLLEVFVDNYGWSCYSLSDSGRKVFEEMKGMQARMNADNYCHY